MANDADLEVGGKIEMVDQAVKFLLDCEVKTTNQVHKPCIFKVPSALRAISPDSYNPRVVSIGPFHREAKNVKAMEARKGTYLHNLLDRLELPHEQTLKTCVEKVTSSIDEIRASYSEMITYTDLELSQMMVMDGIFIVEFFYNNQEYLPDTLLAIDIFYDLWLLENQIPFFVLQDLFECTIMEFEPNASLKNIILSDLQALLFKNFRVEMALKETYPDHLLGLIHICHQPEKTSQPQLQGKKIHSACELDRAGVKFMPIQDPSWAMEIKFEPPRLQCFSWSWGKPTLRMPVIQVFDNTESLMRNLIVYEQSCKHVPLYITSYAMFIDTLVDTKKDIVMLVDSGVIINDLGSTEELANVFNNICKQIDVERFFYNQEWFKIDEYYNGYWPKNIARLRRTYFNSPWNIIALLAGIVLFFLTVIQTIFTVKQAV